MEAIEYVVYDENTLGYLIPQADGSNSLGILHASTLKGATLSDMEGWTSISNTRKIRPATAQDFEDFNVTLPPDFKPPVKGQCYTQLTPAEQADIIKELDAILFKDEDEDDNGAPVGPVWMKLKNNDIIQLDANWMPLAAAKKLAKTFNVQLQTS